MPIEDERGNIIGAIGFVLYDRLEGLKPLLARVTQLESDLRLARRQLSHARTARLPFADYVGVRPRIAQAKELAARQNVTVLLTGETGTSKEMLAQAIHNASPRAKKPFISVNVAAIADTLIESEFFGTQPGAYTGADRKGPRGKIPHRRWRHAVPRRDWRNAAPAPGQAAMSRATRSGLFQGRSSR
jgi:transcriptional regulator with PAS, ATPase and Fis domain